MNPLKSGVYSSAQSIRNISLVFDQTHLVYQYVTIKYSNKIIHSNHLIHSHFKTRFMHSS